MSSRVPEHLVGRSFPPDLTVETMALEHGPGYVGYDYLAAKVDESDQSLWLKRDAPVAGDQDTARIRFGCVAEVRRKADGSYRVRVLLRPHPSVLPMSGPRPDEAEYVRVDDVEG